jgi:RimJ/RimL family protein N-acetyltransferase
MLVAVMSPPVLPPDQYFLARGPRTALRRIDPSDLAAIARFEYTVSITEPLTDSAALEAAFAAEEGFWTGGDHGALAIVERSTAGDRGRLIGTAQYYRAGPCIHGYELGYILHELSDRGRGLGAEAVRLFSNLLFDQIAGYHRQQLMIETWNVASWRLAERCGFVREGLLRSSGLGDGDPADCYIYSRTRKDWREERSSTMGLPQPL